MHPPPGHEKLIYSSFEQNSLARMKWFADGQAGYGQIQRTKPRTVGFAMHDSPIGMLAWISDKLLQWSDDYPWTKDELITWTLLHYFPGPSTAFQIYRENLPLLEAGERPPGVEDGYVSVPTGVSAFGREVYMVPRAWTEGKFNVVEWKEWEKGGHFPAYERPEELSGDIIRHTRAHWKD